MYRSLGRMFILSSKAELTQDLNADISRINSENERSTALKTALDEKKEYLTKQLNDLAPSV